MEPEEDQHEGYENLSPPVQSPNRTNLLATQTSSRDVEAQQSESQSTEQGSSSGVQSPQATAHNQIVPASLFGRRTRRVGSRSRRGTQQDSLDNDLRELADLAQTREARQILTWLWRMAPFLLVFGIKLVLDHVWRIVALVVAIVFFVVSNVTFVNHVVPLASASNGNRRKRWLAILKVMAGPLIWLIIIFGILHNQLLWAPLIFSPALPDYLAEHTSDFCSALWRVFVADVTIKFIAIVIKLLISTLPMVSLRRRRHAYQCTEYVNQLYRYLVTPVIWLPYLLSDGHNTGWFYTTVNICLVVIYSCAKLWQSRQPIMMCYTAGRSLMKHSVFGSTPTAAALSKAGGQCAICFTEFTKPIQLSCEHVFCEECISTWLDKERTCPICRAELTQDDNSYKDGSTSCLIQFV